ncbi:DUF6382 domain-containing protein [Paenibacillus protaetiae]|nr:DUF6382 domain-containing protein [Paenibacillus protaetiae]
MLNKLVVDFSMARGHEMLIEREGGFRREHLEEVELHMLQQYKMPRLLDVDWLEVNGIFTFRYNLEGRKLLRHKLQLQPITMQQFYELLLAVVEALDECRHYMLRPEGCLLSHAYLFAGEQLTDIKLAYLPLKATAGTEGYGDLMSLLVGWSAYIDEMDGAGFQKLLQHLNTRSLSCQELRAALLELIGESLPVRMNVRQLRNASGRAAASAASRAAQDAWNDTDKIHIASAKGAPVQDVSFKEHDVVQVQEPLSLLEYGDADSPHEDVLEDEPMGWEMNDEAKPANPNRIKWMLSAAVVLTDALIWRYMYLGSQSQSGLFICCGLTLLAAAGLLFIWRKPNEGDSAAHRELYAAHDHDEIKPRLLLPDEEPFLSSASSEMSYTPGQAPRWTYGQSAEKSALAGLSASGAAARSNDQPITDMPLRSGDVSQAWHQYEDPFRIAAEEAAAAAEPGTSGLKWHDATEYLGAAKQENGTGKQTDSGFALYREWNGSEQKLAWDGELFMVGRSDKQVHYTDTASGISRLHFEIEPGDEPFTYSAKDLGSRNGTWLNGEVMIPYKQYPFARGDIIQPAGLNGPKYFMK